MLNSMTANSDDDNAIAPDKAALRPGVRATSQNYTSYSRGINGVMVDIAGLPSNTLTADDFSFRTGNTNSPTGWTTAPTPSIRTTASSASPTAASFKASTRPWTPSSDP